jgi:hypothetical protein
MNINKPSLLFLVIFLLLALITGCATAAQDPPTPEPTVMLGPSCKEVGGNCLELTFDGESCTYEGPTEIAAGPVELFFNNNSEGTAAVNFLMLLEGKTIEDVIEYNGEEPTTKHAPSWSRELGTWRPISAGESHHWEGELEPANYFMVCARLAPLGVWLGTGLTVEG